ncbi:response regulator transcription factor [candidate division KSB1 bacterium]|nr:response regulator transcription factor [candidate division KSB1 bacterium]
MMAKVLVVEDEIEMANGLKDALMFDGHKVSLAYDGEAGLNEAVSGAYELILLDIKLPKKSGFDVCREIRAQNIRTPVIMLTARGREVDKVLGLELGADDYITKPFSVMELLARIKAVLRRYADKQSNGGEWIRIGKLKVDFSRYMAEDDDGPLELLHKEYEILKYLWEHRGEKIRRDQLLDRVWGYDVFPSTRTVDNYIVKLRKHVEDDPNRPKHIITVYGIGYTLIA